MWGLGWFGQADLHFSGQNRCEGRERAGVLMSRLLVNSAAQRVREGERARERERARMKKANGPPTSERASERVTMTPATMNAAASAERKEEEREEGGAVLQHQLFRQTHLSSLPPPPPPPPRHSPFQIRPSRMIAAGDTEYLPNA